MPIEHTGNVQLSKKENKLLFVEIIWCLPFLIGRHTGWLAC
jgi:hypothetical protein